MEHLTAAVSTRDQPSRQEYLLGAAESEQQRLDVQSATLAMPTAIFLHRAGIAPGMRALDLGTGLGDVAFQLSELVGPTGAVVAIDESPAMLAVAERRRVSAGIQNVRFVEADARRFRDGDAFDAVVGRLIWCYLPDPLEVVRHHLGGLTEGGVVLVIDQDAGTVRSEPQVPLVAATVRWGLEAHRRAGADALIGARLGLILKDAGLADVTTFGIQDYLSPDDPAGPALVSGIVHTLALPSWQAGSRPSLSWIWTRSRSASLESSGRGTPSSCSRRSPAPGAASLHDHSLNELSVT